MSVSSKISQNEKTADVEKNSAGDTALASPSFNLDDVLRDWSKAYELLGSGKLDQYGGKHVVLFEGKVVSSGEDPLQLRNEMAEQFSVPPERFAVLFVENTECIVSE